MPLNRLWLTSWQYWNSENIRNEIFKDKYKERFNASLSQ